MQCHNNSALRTILLRFFGLFTIYSRTLVFLPRNQNGRHWFWKGVAGCCSQGIQAYERRAYQPAGIIPWLLLILMNIGTTRRMQNISRVGDLSKRYLPERASAHLCEIQSRKPKRVSRKQTAHLVAKRHSNSALEEQSMKWSLNRFTLGPGPSVSSTDYYLIKAFQDLDSTFILPDCHAIAGNLLD